MTDPINENQLENPATGPLELTSTQRQVIEILRSKKSQRYPLAEWYLGAIYAAKNINNPDRFSQAAQSLRELLEKMPRVFVESEIQESRPDFQGMRNNLYSRLRSDRTRYEGAWEGKLIDVDLDKTIRGVDHYFELNKTPTRPEQIHALMAKIDPMHDTLNQETRLEKSKRLRSLWKYFQALAHHNTNTDEKAFWEQLAQAELLIIDLLAPITAQDQGTIRAIIEKPQPELADVEKLLGLIKRRGANFAYFFNTVDNPAWIYPLVENRIFTNPPRVETEGNGHIITPLWWPIFFLQRVSDREPERVVKIILSMEHTDNPRILREIFSIACDLEDTALSLRLKRLIKQFLKSPYRWGEVDLIVKILKKWGNDKEPSRNAAFEVIRYVVAFQPDPKADEKRSRLKNNPEAWSISPEPIPRFEKWEYQQILENGVRPLSEQEPYQVSRILIDAVAGMIRLGMHPEDFERRIDQDYSEIWCQRLDKPDQDYQDVKDMLVQTLTYACEQVYDKAPGSIDALDQALRNDRWKVFKRLRQHLYASHPNDQTLPWIREQILGNDDYHKWEHHYEFQLMIRKASEHFGLLLLSEDERRGIFDTILSGPSKDDFREWMGERYSEEAFQQRQRYFHRMQLRPFTALLSGDVRRYFDELDNETQAEAVTDDSYSPYSGVTSGWVSQQSPKTVENLENFTDEELLTYMNDWDEEHREKDNGLVEITIVALAEVFQSLFKDKIVPDATRLAFWLANRDRIARPIYTTVMLKAMIEIVKEKNLNNLEHWIAFCAWILSHPDTARVEGQPELREDSRDYPDWNSSRRAVVDFIDTCVDKDMDVPIDTREGLAALLRLACSQADWRLDHDSPVLLNHDDPITEAINNTRSRALQSLVNFGFWIRRQLPEDQLPDVTNILAKRIAEDAETPLTRPERALLGMHFGNLCALNRDWAAEKRDIFFPQTNEAIWRDAFGSYIRYNHPIKMTFEILRGEFDYATENLNILATEKGDDMELINRLGQHLFTYYLWGVYPLTGAESLLERFYDKTKGERKRWVQLFDHVGRLLRNSGTQLDNKLTDRIIAFFDWRFKATEPLELQKFSYWLEAECLEPEWRLQSYSKILDLGHGKDNNIYLQVKALNKLLQDHLTLVVECFAKITDAMDQGTQMYISADEAKPILKAGLTAEDPLVRKYAERAREKLLRLGRFDYLDI